jgi:hypothetical protein
MRQVDGSGKYNGWANRATWNVALWIGNDEGLYDDACRFMREYSGRAPYRQFICSRGMRNDRTPDSFRWLGEKLCLSELNAMMFELIG